MVNKGPEPDHLFFKDVNLTVKLYKMISFYHEKQQLFSELSYSLQKPNLFYSMYYYLLYFLN